MLAEKEERRVKVFLLTAPEKLKGSPRINYDRIVQQQRVEITELCAGQLPVPGNHVTLVDALFGSGLNRALEGFPAEVVRSINLSGATVLSVDMPSGLMGEHNEEGNGQTVVQANRTLTFQFPKLSFFFPENERYTGKWEIVDIGLHSAIMGELDTPFRFLTREELVGMVKPRSVFSHKGTFGHALLVSGSYGRMGAAVLASRSCLRSGVGLLTTHVPRLGYPILQTAVPEAMTSIDESDLLFSGISPLGPFSAVGAGPALGLKNNTQTGLHRLISECRVPMVLDADALNILGLHTDWIGELPPQTILTPHPKEFERMFGEARSGYERVMCARENAAKYGLILVLKGAYTAVALPDGTCWFNASGNPGMATAGSGDVLTGIILALLAQGYSPGDASLLGVYVHGLAGDRAAKDVGKTALIASDIIDHLGMAFKSFDK